MEQSPPSQNSFGRKHQKKYGSQQSRREIILATVTSSGDGQSSPLRDKRGLRRKKTHDQAPQSNAVITNSSNEKISKKRRH